MALFLKIAVGSSVMLVNPGLDVPKEFCRISANFTIEPAEATIAFGSDCCRSMPLGGA